MKNLNGKQLFNTFYTLFSAKMNALILASSKKKWSLIWLICKMQISINSDVCYLSISTTITTDHTDKSGGLFSLFSNSFLAFPCSSLLCCRLLGSAGVWKECQECTPWRMRSFAVTDHSRCVFFEICDVIWFLPIFACGNEEVKIVSWIVFSIHSIPLPSQISSRVYSTVYQFLRKL